MVLPNAKFVALGIDRHAWCESCHRHTYCHGTEPLEQNRHTGSEGISCNSRSIEHHPRLHRVIAGSFVLKDQ